MTHRSLTLLLIGTSAALAQPGATRENWPSYGGTHYAWRYSELTQVTAANVARLQPQFAFQTGEVDGGLQATPIVIDGVIYLSLSLIHI